MKINGRFNLLYIIKLQIAGRFILSNIVIGVCKQLQLKQSDGAAPLSADIQSNPIRVIVTYDSMSSTERTWNLTVPASGIVTLTVPVNAAKNFISMAVNIYTVTQAYDGAFWTL